MSAGKHEKEFAGVDMMCFEICWSREVAEEGEGEVEEEEAEIEEVDEEDEEDEELRDDDAAERAGCCGEASII